jgi:hypothetical protein
MEKAAGVPLFERWGNMNEFEKLQLIKNLTKLEAQLSPIQFPAYGGLYFRTDIKGSTRSLDDDIDPSQSFEIGPSCDRAFDHNTTREFKRGPCALPLILNVIYANLSLGDTLSSFGSSIARRELLQISNTGRQDMYSFYKGTVDEQSELLEITMGLMKLLDSNELLKKVSQPTLWHTDLHMGNIFVAPEECSKIVSLIDFQSTSVLPAFLQAQWPVFLRPPQNYDYVKGIFHPELPEKFEELDEESKAIALREWTQVKLAKAYEVSTYLKDRPACNAMNVPRVFQELFTRCGEVSEMGIVPLRACLIEISQSWSELGFHEECPFTFSQQDIDEHERQFAEYQAWDGVRALAEECLDTDSEGWIAPQLDINEKRSQNEELLAMYIERVAGERSVQEAKAMWPFS